MQKLISKRLFLIFISLFSCNSKPKTLFTLVPAEESGITFINTIIESEDFNILTEEYIYNGGGIAVADFNNDQLQDLYFTGNMVNNCLYQNKGNLEFDDITTIAQVAGEERWSSGVTAVDINQDGWMDIYISATMEKDPEKRRNLLYINQGLNDKGIPIFKELAKSYGLDDTGNTTQTTFFDYDKDGDLDAYLLTNVIDTRLPGSYRKKITDGTSINNDRLYRNNGNNTFTDVSKEAGIVIEGFGLGITITDINLDTWPDIYITNDYLSNDLMYINNQDGTFSNKLETYLKHQSHSAMGHDVVDINNDGLVDIFALDMLPETNERQKQMLGASKYINYINNEKYGYQYQVVRNTLQLNNGINPNGHPTFSEVGQYANIFQTDWSWTPLVADFDNDGNRDIIITNGFPRDVTDKDFTMYRAGPAGSIASKMFLNDSIPVVKISNYAYKNNGALQFDDVTEEWGMKIPSFSNGAVYTDLDNDGDLDVVCNNINDYPFLYENKLLEGDNKPKKNYLRLKFEGEKPNLASIGAKAMLFYGENKQFYENVQTRGYISSVEPFAHFGVGETTTIDSLLVQWPNGKEQLISNIAVNQVLVVKQSEATLTNNPAERLSFFTLSERFLQKSNTVRNINFTHSEVDRIDFNLQRTIPHKFSQMGPGLAVGDVNGDALEDFIVGGPVGKSALLFLQSADGSFQEPSPIIFNEADTKKEDLGLLLFDADNDSDLDLYICSGGFEYFRDYPEFQDALYLNDGQGKFTKDDDAIPESFISTASVKAADYDGDGFLDLFVGGRVKPGAYPTPVSSKILHNEGGKFIDVSDQVCPTLNEIGMVSDALWTDFNNDNKIDLILVGEWMPLTFLKNTGTQFEDVTQKSEIGENTGWWNSITGADFDHDGDIDYVAGNLGLNTRYKTSLSQPLKMIAKDFDNSNSIDPILSIYLKNSEDEVDAYPLPSLQDLISQMQYMRRKYPRFSLYGTTTFDQLFSEEDKQDAMLFAATEFASCYIENLGDGTFYIKKLPLQVQFGPIYGSLPQDIDNDGYLDLVLVGNSYATEVFTGRYDALIGLILKGNGRGDFTTLPSNKTGFFVDGDAKALVQLFDANNKNIILASQNKDKLLSFESSNPTQQTVLSFKKDDAKVVFTFKDGTSRISELYYGNTYLSQSSRKMVIPRNTANVQVINFQGETREQTLQ
ncbi:MAG: FG-GAP-like repeat-containing protein [Bacteroidota bacterium]